jgi:hypothetical protein
MKGKLTKIENNWYVSRIEEGDWETSYPLHPKDIHNYLFYFEEGKEIEFEVVKFSYGSFAEISNNIYDSDEIELANDVWKKVGDDNEENKKFFIKGFMLGLDQHKNPKVFLSI